MPDSAENRKNILLCPWFFTIMSLKLQQLILVLVLGAKFQKLLQMLLTSLEMLVVDTGDIFELFSNIVLYKKKKKKLTNFDLEDVILHNFIF